MAGKSFHFNGIQAVLTDLGMDAKKANMVASASQAVDDFHEDKLIVFDDGRMFYPVVTAHKSFDADNLDSRDASNVWMPFHFFPNAHGVCEPDTPNVDLLIQFVKTRIDSTEYTDNEKCLYLGILLHILVDTFTHRGFMGLYCRHNDISALEDEDAFDLGFTANALPAIGHGEALTYPDDMWRRWSYRDHQDVKQTRDNKEVFSDIVEKIPGYLQRLGMETREMDRAKASKYKEIFAMEEGHDKAFDQITLANVPAGESIGYQYWRDQTLRGVQSKDNTWIKIDPNTFESSNWVLFQKAAKEIRTFFKEAIFPGLTINTKVY